MSDHVGRRRRAIFLAIATAGLSISSPAVVAGKENGSGLRARSSFVAAGTTVFSAATPVYTDLVIPPGARLDLNYVDGKNRPPAFSEAPALGAIALVSTSDASSAYVAVRLPESDGASRPFLTLGPANCQVDEFCEVPPGDYRLYAVTEQPMTVKLTLEGISGKSRIRRAERVAAEIGSASTSYLHTTPRGPVEVAAHGAGFEPDLTGERNLLFSSFWFRGASEPPGPPPADRPLAQVGNAGSCLYRGAPPAEAYAPGCPGGQGSGSFLNAQALSDFGFMQWNALVNIPPGTYGRGYYAVHSGIRDPGFAAFWLDLTIR